MSRTEIEACGIRAKRHMRSLAAALQARKQAIARHLMGVEDILLCTKQEDAVLGNFREWAGFEFVCGTEFTLYIDRRHR